ncbi:MAG TPA: hypothetical protein VJN95_15030 [Gemmatimonadales bacterium]|nr:hypothetical protein [Gemmatimonadales bacterium]
MDEALARLWAEHRGAAAPDLSGVETPGVDLVPLVAVVEDCIGRFLTGGELDYGRTMQLKQAYIQLWSAENDLPAAAAPWVDRLRAICRLVLERTAVETP